MTNLQPFRAGRSPRRAALLALAFALAGAVPSTAAPIAPSETPLPSVSLDAAGAPAPPLQPESSADLPRPAPPLNPLAPPLANTFPGINFHDNAIANGFYFIPPDPIGAAGQAHVVSVVNCTIQWFTKAGALQNTQRLGMNSASSIVGSFFEVLAPANSLFDPKVIYDQHGDRFVVVALEVVRTTTVVTSSRILVAVSRTGDPNAGWWFTAINSKLNIGGLDRWADYPGLAVDNQAVYVTNNMFSAGGGYGGSRFWILNKVPFYTGGAAAFNVYDAYAAVGFPSLATTTQPTTMYGAAPAGVGTFLVSYSGLTDGTNEYIDIIRVDNPLGVPAFNFQQLPVGNIDNTGVSLPQLLQSGSATSIDTGDRRAQNAVWRNNTLAMCASLNPNAGSPDAGQCTAHWWQLDTSTLATLALTDQGNVGGEDIAAACGTAYPSVALDFCGNMAIGFAASAQSIFAGACYTGRLLLDPAGTVQPSVTLKAGLASYVRTFGGARNRWGDYSGTCIDPDGSTFWHFNEYADTQGDPTGAEVGRWATQWGAWTFNCTTVPVTLAYFTAERSGGGATLRWGAGDAYDHAGFNVYRETAGGERIRLNGALLSGSRDYQFSDASAPADEAGYWLEELSRTGDRAWHGPVLLGAAAVSFPVAFNLAPGQPNPFRAATSIAYSLAEPGRVRLSVFDVMGRRVATLVDGVEEAGPHAVSWDGRTEAGDRLASGFYLMRLESGGRVRSQKVVLTR